ncbi:pentatricopeptide repeat-containing protein At1g31430-like isoform X2 [Raphanus sativus]|uniref:Pentatricopeptide repeat-containing protein At1g31430 isoform X2 n=1 Tax=Raphanus sativus TaxID=3726 RepID=A0A9W3CUN7_RAPSA|nr:pentatricopeptide repeat-containing protein At1g31430 isoform X2 [Raphanus sativus]XP_056855321.1 pentatricopeptide repeat-containing protein At1g31430-like isoform X2 [Raphanus sativus]
MKMGPVQTPSLIVYNKMLKSFADTKTFTKVLSLFAELRRNALYPDNFTLPIILKSIGRLRNVAEGEKLHGYALKSGLNLDPYVCNSLMGMYAALGKMEIARKVFDEMPQRDVVSWNGLISSYVGHGRFDDAVAVFKRMSKESDLKPDESTIVSTLSACSALKNLELGEVIHRFDEALELFRRMQSQGVRPDNFVLVSLLKGCAQTGGLEQGKWIHGYICENRVRVDKVVGTALVDMYAKCGCIETALEVFYETRERDTASWTSLIYGLAMNGMSRRAMDLYYEMENGGVRLDDITFVSVLTACNHGGFVGEGRGVFYSMSNVHKVRPKSEHYSCMIDLLCRAGCLEEAEELIDEMRDESDKTLVPVYCSLLSAARNYGNVELAERVAEKLEKVEVSDSSAHTLLASVYASANKWEDVTNVRSKMKDLGIRKFPGCSSVEIDGVPHESIVGDTSSSSSSHPKTDEIKYNAVSNYKLDVEFGT